MANHEWVPSTLGHGETMCRFCKITNREAAAIGEYECSSIPVPAETGTRSPDNPPPGTVGAITEPKSGQPNVQQLERQTRFYAQIAGRFQRPLPGKPQVVDYAGIKTARLSGPKDPPLVEQLARRLETYADDQDAMSRRFRNGRTVRANEHRADTYRSSAAALREAMTAQNKALYQVEINTILERFGVVDNIKDEISLAIIKEFMG